MNQYIRSWQAKPAGLDRPYFTPAQTSYYEHTKTEKPTPFPVLAWIAPNAVLAWAEWAAHEACVHGNDHSVAASVFLGAVSAVSAGVALAGFNSRSDTGAMVAAVLGPVSLILGGFAVLLWAPGWPAVLAGSLMLTALNAGIWSVRTVLRRFWRRMVHDAGMQHDASTRDLEKQQLETLAVVVPKAIEYQRDVDLAYELAVREAVREARFHERHPDIFPAPALIPVTAPKVIGDAREPLAMAAGAEYLSITTAPAGAADDWMDLARTLGVVKEEKR